VIETERLILRLPRPNDVEELAAIYAEPETMRFVGGTVEAADVQGIVERIPARWEQDGFGQLLAERREDGRVVGRFGIFTWETLTWHLTRDLSLSHEVELGWLLGQEFQGQGYATEASLALREWTLRELAPPRLISLVNVHNSASTALARRLGCVSDGRVETAHFGLSEIWTHPA
jgi:ribosomal-protein-alanine N-acetyltransferase